MRALNARLLAASLGMASAMHAPQREDEPASFWEPLRHESKHAKARAMRAAAKRRKRK